MLAQSGEPSNGPAEQSVRFRRPQPIEEAHLNDALLVPRELLQAVRDYIGSMPTLDSLGKDRFFDALRIVEPLEKILARSEVAPNQGKDAA